MLPVVSKTNVKTLTMVKNKRDLKSPRRNRSFTGARPINRARSAPSIDAANIRVVVRARPPNDRENGNSSRNIIKVVDDHTMVFDPKEEDEPFFYHGIQQKNRDIMKRANKDLQFTFDRVFGFEATNNIVFENSTKCLIQTLMKGYNCSVFVYGATGAGKTHTMLGCGIDPGITFLTMTELFQQKETLSQERDFEIGMTYLEVYNETVQDLLNPGPALHLREDGKYGVVVAGIKVHRIEESEKLFELLEQGSRNRTQHPTDANAESSRSHAVFQVYLRMKFKTSGETRVAKLSMIDLAGSERGAATGYSGARFAEGANINKSLLALGNCINSLADGHRHVPYRDSKLTRLLKDSLGGNCQTVMVANVSPSSLSYEDTYNTLKYAMRAKKIKSTIKKNIVNCEVNLNHYIKLVDDLTKENQDLKLQLSKQIATTACKCSEAAEKDDTNLKLQDELKTLYADKRELEQRVSQLESTKQLMSLRKQIKEESDSRLSGICSDSAEKKQGHLRLGNAVDRLERQAAGIQQEIKTLRNRNEQIETRLREFLQKSPHLLQIAEKEDQEIAYMKATNKTEHLQKVCNIQAGELRMRDQLIERFSEVLQPCFLQLRGHGHATETLASSYRDLVRHLQGIRSVTWDDESRPVTPSDSGVSSTTTVNETEDQRPIKRKLPEDASMDRTFVLPDSKPLAICAEKLMAKASTSTSEEASEIADQTIIISQSNICSEQVTYTAVYKSTPPEEVERNEHQNVCAEELMLKLYKPSPDEKLNVPDLDRTRVLSPANKNIISAKQLMTKVYKKSPKVTKNKTDISPRNHKENKATFQARPLHTSTNVRIGSTQDNSKNKTFKLKPSTITRPHIAYRSHSASRVLTLNRPLTANRKP